jgi:hypothetical protein
MKKNYSFIFVLFCLQTFSQEPKNIDSIYSNYFENTREITYLHLNKTTFLEGEEIWFQAYILEQNSKKPHPTTSNLYISIFDNEGILKEQQLIHIKKGKGFGSINLDSTYSKESYYIKASTKWMKNFNEANSYTQKIKLLSNKRKPKITSNTEEEFFDFQVFPESGYFLEDSQNNAGILIKDKNGKGQKIVKGIIRESNSTEVIGNFSTNSFGLGKLNFYYQSGTQYILEATLKNGSSIHEKLPIAKQKGIAMQIKNPNAKFIEISLLTNSKTLECLTLM